MRSGLAEALDRTGVSVRNAVYILSGDMSGEGHNTADFVLGRVSIGQKRINY